MSGCVLLCDKRVSITPAQWPHLTLFAAQTEPCCPQCNLNHHFAKLRLELKTKARTSRSEVRIVQSTLKHIGTIMGHVLMSVLS